LSVIGLLLLLLLLHASFLLPPPPPPPIAQCQKHSLPEPRGNQTKHVVTQESEIASSSSSSSFVSLSLLSFLFFFFFFSGQTENVSRPPKTRDSRVGRLSKPVNASINHSGSLLFKKRPTAARADLRRLA
jgi:hypothetical protein